VNTRVLAGTRLAVAVLCNVTRHERRGRRDGSISETHRHVPFVRRARHGICQGGDDLVTCGSAVATQLREKHDAPHPPPLAPLLQPAADDGVRTCLRVDSQMGSGVR
jgi:hypothetical protein